MSGDPQIFMASDKTALRFFYEATKNNFLSEQNGRAIYDNVMYVEVMTPGSKESAPTLEVEREFNNLSTNPTQVNEQVYERYRSQIESFKANSSEGQLDGTPITQWPHIDAGLAATLRAANIFTVEQLAQLPDANLGIVGIGGHTLRERARAFINNASFGGNTELLAKLEEMQRTIDAQTAQIAALQNVQVDTVAVQTVATAETPAPPLGGLGSVI
jgi:hypothetical protein